MKNNILKRFDLTGKVVAITGGQRREVSSYSQSYGGPSVRFSDGTPYHVIMEYSRERKTAGISVSFLSNGSTLWGYSLAGITNLGPLDRLYLSTIGDFENPSAAAEGDLDNVAMRLVFPSSRPETPASPSPTTMITGGETGTVTGTATRTPPLVSTVPVTTTQGSPLTSLLVITALALAALLILSPRK